MFEQSKAARRRYFDGAFVGRYFVGRGIDIGAGGDPLGNYRAAFPLMGEVVAWDIPDGDAQYMPGIDDGSFDFVHSSHCLEDMRDVREALRSWTRILKPGGFLVITVPDEDLYEHGHWPSRFNGQHRWSFTICKAESAMPRSVNVVDLAREFSAQLELERLALVRDFYREDLDPAIDQTTGPVAECAIEIVWRKRDG